MQNAVSNSIKLHRGLMQLRQAASSNLARGFSTDSKVVYEQHSSHAFEFKLNHNKALNSVDLDMIQLINNKLHQWHITGSSPRIALISGTGGKAFCAGGDIVSIYNANVGKLPASMKADFFAYEYLADYALTQMKPLQISIWNGIVMGGGVGVSCHAPIRVATDNTVYAMPETGIGFFTDVGGSYFLSRVKNNTCLGMYLGLTGHRLKA